MQAALTDDAHSPSEAFPNTPRIYELTGEQDVTKQINNSVTRNRFLQRSATAEPAFLTVESRRGEKKISKIQ